jgi:hypothetical protein
MATKVKTLTAWVQTRNTLIQNLSSTLELLETASFSTDPGSDFVRGNAEADRIQDQLRQLALAGLKQVDDAIASGTLVKDITTLSKEAKKEADRITNATKTITAIARGIDLAAGVVTKIAGLPFLP